MSIFRPILRQVREERRAGGSEGRVFEESVLCGIVVFAARLFGTCTCERVARRLAVCHRHLGGCSSMQLSAALSGALHRLVASHQFLVEEK